MIGLIIMAWKAWGMGRLPSWNSLAWDTLESAPPKITYSKIEQNNPAGVDTHSEPRWDKNHRSTPGNWHPGKYHPHGNRTELTQDDPSRIDSAILTGHSASTSWNGIPNTFFTTLIINQHFATGRLHHRFPRSRLRWNQ